MTKKDDRPMRTGTPTPEKAQIDKFKEAARELETDDREEAFDEKLKKVAKAPLPKGDKR